MSSGEITASEGAQTAQGEVAGAAATIIPSVAKEADRGVGSTAKFFFVIGGVALISVLAFVFYRMTVKATAKVDVASPSPAVAVAGTRSTKSFDSELPANDPQKGPANARGGTAVPALRGSDDDPIGVRSSDAASRQAGAGNNSAAVGASTQAKLNPLDAPILLTQPAKGGGVTRSPATSAASETQRSRGVDSTSELLTQTREQLASIKQDLLDRQTTLRTAAASSGQPAAPAAPMLAASSVGGGAPSASASGSVQNAILEGGARGSATTRVRAGVLGDRNLTLPKGSTFTCALKTRVISAQAGLVGCTVMRDVFSDNGKVLLVPRGSHLDGEYKVTQVRPGTTRIPVLWTRVRTPEGVTVDLDSPATGPLGESGSDAYVDNRWGERIGAALLVSLIEDSVNVLVNNSTAPSNGTGTFVLQGTAQTTSKMAEKVLDSTINLPPLLYQNQGGIVGVYTAHDIDFASVYALEPVAQ